MAECPSYTTDVEYWNGIGCQVEGLRQQLAGDSVELMSVLSSLESTLVGVSDMAWHQQQEFYKLAGLVNTLTGIVCVLLAVVAVLFGVIFLKAVRWNV